MEEWTGKQVAKLAFVVCMGFAVLIGGWMVGMPYYWVFHQRLDGEAQLAKAEFSKKVLVQDSLARLESAKNLADAEVIRAEGVAKANKIIGGSLEGNESYLHYLWIHNLELGNHDVIYVPTEAGLPIFEAGGRFQERKAKSTTLKPGDAEHPDSKED